MIHTALMSLDPMKRIVATACLASITSGCANLPTSDSTALACRTENFILDANFASAGMESCSTLDHHSVEVFLTPENTPINKSPWYAVRLTPIKKNTTARIILRYMEHPHRYQPKISNDSKWSPIPKQNISVSDEGYSVTIEVTLNSEPVFLAGQELFDNQVYTDWISELAQSEEVTYRTIGYSVEDRPITLLETKARHTPAPTLMMVGRQHPPEITGAMAMAAFVGEVLGESRLARRFRSHFNIVMIPNMNPDGVTHGHWRHNVGGVDLNRDWGPFTQPETQAIRNFLDSETDRNFAVFLDFHSTWKNVFYTQPQGDDGTDYGFTRLWMTQARERLPAEFAFARQGSHNTTPTSKTYMNTRFGIPAITYETGDETDRELIRLSATVFAQEMMKILLDRN